MEIEKIRTSLSQELEKTEKKLNHHMRKATVLNDVEYAITALTSIISTFPLGIVLEVFSGLCGIGHMITKTLKKRVKTKVDKYQDMYATLRRINEIQDDSQALKEYNNFRKKLSKDKI